jgi:hypothetical protein
MTTAILFNENADAGPSSGKGSSAAFVIEKSTRCVSTDSLLDDSDLAVIRSAGHTRRPVRNSPYRIKQPLTHAEWLELASKKSPPPSWFSVDEECPF